MTRSIPASLLLAVFFLVIYMTGGYQGYNGLSLLITLCLIWFGWALWAHLDHEVATARTDYEAAHSALRAERTKETNR